MTIAAPLALHEERVRPEWIDYNGHMNVAYYVLAFDHATDTFLDFVGLDHAYRQSTQCSTFAVEAHVTYQQEVKEADPLRITTQLLSCDSKRMHYFHTMYHADEGYRAATLEQLSLHVDLSRRRVAAMPNVLFERVVAVRKAHAGLGRPVEAGRVIGDV